MLTVIMGPVAAKWISKIFPKDEVGELPLGPVAWSVIGFLVLVAIAWIVISIVVFLY